MRGIRITAIAWLAARWRCLRYAACKKGKDSDTAADEKREPPPPSGTMSLQGMYSYMADAGSFVDCATREQWPVAHEGDNATLGARLRASQDRAGSPVLVTVEGGLDSRPKVDGGARKRT